ncbi:unnamed protein product [Linum trigynum]|uniref:Uncharacterized protein n=1 Tax=Linum trigynum TaxID=586398 RepID=A0AAV2EUY4_9ROSI
MSSMKASSPAGGGGSGESSRLAARPVSAGAGAAGPPTYAETDPAPSRCEPGSPLLGLHRLEALSIGIHPGLILDLVSRVLLLELKVMVEELLILDTQLLELVSEVVLGWESGTATPVIEGGMAGSISSVHVLGVDILSGLILRNIGLVLRWEWWSRKPLAVDASLRSCFRQRH